MYDLNVSDSLLGQAVCGIKFFYTVTLNREWRTLQYIRIKKKKKLPVILSKEEVREILEKIVNLKHQFILSVIYSGGLRIGEACRLKIQDVDSKRMLIKINLGKGKKDRYTILGAQTLRLMKEYLKTFQPKEWLFPGQPKSKHISARAVELVFHKACNLAGIRKKVTVHSLRHSFATHLMENGTNFRLIQAILGHSRPSTTLIYTHVCKYHIEELTSPIDSI